MNKYIITSVAIVISALLTVYSSSVSADIWTLTTGMLDGKEIPIAIYEPHEIEAICSSKKETPEIKKCFVIDPSTMQKVAPNVMLFQTKAITIDKRNIQAEKENDYNEKHYM